MVAVAATTRSGKPRKQSWQRAAGERPHWDLRLYVAHDTPRSLRAYEYLKRFCEAYLAGRYRIRIVDVIEHPEIAKRDQIVATPTVIRRRPLPARILVGDLANTQLMLVGLDLATRT